MWVTLKFTKYTQPTASVFYVQNDRRDLYVVRYVESVRPYDL